MHGSGFEPRHDFQLEILMASTKQEYEKRMSLFKEMLGGKCAKCGSTENLQMDHIDHEAKSFTISKRWALKLERLIDELAKCQLLCGKHHKEKTLAEGSLAKGANKQARQVHGTVWSYTKYKCRCEACRSAKSKAMKHQRLRVAQSG